MMVTGASGFLGRHLVEASEAGGWELLAPGSQAFDIRRNEHVQDEIRTWKPNAVVHLAYRPDDRRVIVDGSRHVAAAAAAVGARLVHMSTDMVFAGRAEPYTEADAPDATLDYGRWKAEAESAVATAYPAALLVRASLLYGTGRLGRPQEDVADVLAGRKAMRFFTDEYRCPTHAADVATALVQVAGMTGLRGPLHVAARNVLSRADLARTFADWMGLDPDRVPTASLAESGLTRPGRVVLDPSLAESLGIRCRPIDEWLRR